jgi:hypothetical protein
MKDKLVIAGLILAGILVVFAFVWGYRAFSNATVPVSTFSPAPSVMCVKLVTADGVAVDCWREQ